MRRCEVCFAPLPAWEDAYLWPCAHGGLTVCADCFDTLVGGLSRRELAARLSARPHRGRADHVRFFFAVLTEAIQIFFSSVHLPSVCASSRKRKIPTVQKDNRYFWWGKMDFLLRRINFDSIFRAKKNTNHPKRVIGIFGGGRWIRTIEGIASRFTVCPLWPLGNSPICNFVRRWSW